MRTKEIAIKVINTVLIYGLTGYLWTIIFKGICQIPFKTIIKENDKNPIGENSF